MPPPKSKKPRTVTVETRGTMVVVLCPRGANHLSHDEALRLLFRLGAAVREVETNTDRERIAACAELV
jgi:hypothetical protein